MIIFDYMYDAAALAEWLGRRTYNLEVPCLSSTLTR